MATITDRSRMLDEPIPFVAPETVRRAALNTVERFGQEAGDVLDMLGITSATLRDGLGYVDGADICDYPGCTAPIINGVPICHHRQMSEGVRP